MSLTPSTRVVVIGGTSGIGLAVAQATARAGAQVVVGSRSKQSVKRALTLLPDHAAGLPVDVTSAPSLESFFAEVGAFDHLVYTAGDALVRGVITDYDPQEAHYFFDIRLFRALDTVRHALATLHSSGSVTLTSGAAAFHGGTGKLLGTTVSAAVIAAGRSLAAELAPIRVNVVAPGIARTPLWSNMPEQAQEKLFDRAGGDTLLGRVADPEDVAKVYVSLMEQDYVTGNVAVVDGGSVLK
ncbi:SDR family oxidoreductase [Streptomyces sp. MBT62]|uniref:SDR family oxidoreductase n=1 Tax=Streptomyces sp. MBT62 TaxID=2800410 RepID=UPI00190B4FB4|nr:SDR family oxidoreductase [Streptomyces sp. MBT62]MBK3567983.1 SDR family oxidoreductase [Streptomyces sp. MBT62]